MKSFFKTFLLIFFTLLFSSQTKASHILGGEITWECTATGEYIFKMVVYRDCTGIPFTFQNETLMGLGIITLKPDSTKWVRKNNGFLDPECNAQAASQRLSCSNADRGTIQAFYYSSDSLMLQGPSSTSGIDLTWIAPCCRSSQVNNLVASGSQMISAKMFLNGRNFYPCADNSPIFSDHPDYFFCRGYNTTNEYAARDIDGDSLVYSFATTYNSGFSMVQYAPGFSYNNPTPGATFHSSNIPSTLNPRTGILNFSVFNGVGSLPGVYHIVSEVSAYRNGILNAQVRREFPVALIDCPLLPNFTSNQPPQINAPFLVNGLPSFKDSVFVGNLINSSILISDTNLLNQGGQEIKIQISGNNLSHDYSINGSCPIPGDTSCAYIWSFTSPIYDSTKGAYFFQRQTTFNGTLRWTPDCSDLDSNGGARTHYFLIRVQDDHCPVPAIKHEVIEITVLPNPLNPCGAVTSIKTKANWTENVRLFPNPTSGLIQMNLPKQELWLSVYSISGQLLQKQHFKGSTNEEFNLDGPSGIYFLEITNEQGERVFKKIVKQ